MPGSGERSGRRQEAAITLDNASGTTQDDVSSSVPPAGDEGWRRRYAEWAARRARLRADRQALVEARRRGLAARHARKLARGQGGGDR